MLMLTIAKIKSHIKKCKKKGIRFNFLGLVENKDLTCEVVNLFIFSIPSGYVGYDWINGNAKMKKLISSIK